MLVFIYYSTATRVYMMPLCVQVYVVQDACRCVAVQLALGKNQFQ